MKSFLKKQRCESNTWLIVGALIGFIFGFYAGILLISVMIILPVRIEGLTSLSKSSSFFFYFGLLTLTSIWGLVAGGLVGIGTPRKLSNLQQEIGSLHHSTVLNEITGHLIDGASVAKTSKRNSILEMDGPNV